jgi:hypothetical protein
VGSLPILQLLANSELNHASPATSFVAGTISGPWTKGSGIFGKGMESKGIKTVGGIPLATHSFV